MRVVLKGIDSAVKRLADGSIRTYHYAWRGGPRLEGMPGPPQFGGQPVTNIRNVASPHWRGWLRKDAAASSS